MSETRKKSERTFKKIFLVLGTRPQIIKSVPILQEALKQDLCIQIIHTGQHYDASLSQVFFDELSPSAPLVNLNVGSGSHIYQSAEIMLRLEKHLIMEKPSLVLVPGDTNSAFAGAIASVKLGIDVAHLESGARSYDMKMAEEINRRLIDHSAQLLFAPTANCQKNLQGESVTGEIYLTGDTMYDNFLNFTNQADKNSIWEELNLIDNDYILLTTHRSENVDDPAKLQGILQTVQKAKMHVIFPIHPRTKERLKRSGISFNNTNIRAINPVGYIEMLALLKHAKIAITDSGGLQKEAFWSKTPCITIRDRTEWTETVDLGVNFITDVNPARITQALKHIKENYTEIKSKFRNNPYGDGKASEKIVRILKEKINL
ncbi:MAG: UDP-N-acetylglucosamine 2-epimerase (non-hydrolyzing) [Candidatus Bathyarchaeota archaeon]|nr:UDP-N-acetylglucosamine 2-epimerase (non-hydrolyzing) [Candidatus Bathyarchaeota archaeon]